MAAIARSIPHATWNPVAGTLGRILTDLATALGARRAVAFAVDGRTGTPDLAATHGIGARQARALRAFLRRRPLPGDYWRSLQEARRPVFIDVATSATLLPAPWTRLAIGAHLAVPLHDPDTGLVGFLALEMAPPTADQRRVAGAVAGVAAAAIAHARSAREQAEEAARRQLLLEIVREMSRRVPLPELLALICRRTVEAFGLRQATIFYYHARARGYVPLGDFGTPARVVERFARSRYTLRNTPHFDEMTAGRTVVVSRADALADADRALLDMTEVHTLVMLPLRTNDQTRGTLVVGIAEAREVTPEQVRGLEVVAHHAATAIYQARSLRASEKAAQFRAGVCALAIEMNAERSRARALEILCARGRAMFRASAGALLLGVDDRLLGVAADAEPPIAPEAFSVGLAAAEHPAVRALLDGEVVVANSRASAPPPVPGLRSLLAIPLIGSDGGGVLLIGDARNPRHFDPRMADEARVLGALAATSLRNLDLLTRLHEANAELRRVSSLKDQFLANVSHDLRTPLNVIIGYGQLAQDGTFGAIERELEEVLGRMVTSAREQLALVEDLLDLSRIELDRLVVRNASVPLAPLFAEMEFALAGMLRGRPVRAIVHAVEPGCAVWADRARLGQILTNLLGNAVKFTTGGTIELRAETRGHEVRIAVRDTGAGITVEDQARIFEPFHQVEGAQATLGAGLGLAIARRLATLMDGTLEVESIPGVGSTFCLTLRAVAPPAARPTPSLASHGAEV